MIDYKKRLENELKKQRKDFEDCLDNKLKYNPKIKLEVSLMLLDRITLLETILGIE